MCCLPPGRRVRYSSIMVSQSIMIVLMNETEKTIKEADLLLMCQTLTTCVVFQEPLHPHFLFLSHLASGILTTSFMSVYLPLLLYRMFMHMSLNQDVPAMIKVTYMVCLMPDRQCHDVLTNHSLSLNF